MGNQTKEAFKNYFVDGIAGKATITALKKSVEGTEGKKVDGCAEWVSQYWDNNIGGSKQSGVILNAWQMPKQVEAQGGTMLYNIYDNEAFKGVKDTASLKRVTEKILANSKFDYNQVQEGDIVGIYMPSSNMHATALRDGTTKNTHIGIVTGFDKDGVPIVKHNIHGNVHTDKINKLTGSRTSAPKVTSITRPLRRDDQMLPAKQLVVKNQKSPFVLGKGGLSDEEYKVVAKDMQPYMNSVYSTTESLKKIFPDVDMDNINKIAIAIMKKETGYGQYLKGIKTPILEHVKAKIKKTKDVTESVLDGLSKDHSRKTPKGSNILQATGSYIATLFGDVFEGVDKGVEKYNETKSTKIAKFKLSTLSKRERDFLGIHSKKELDEDVEKAGRAVTYILCKNYRYFQKYAQANPDLEMTEDDIINNTGLSYNQGMRVLRHIGYDNTTGLIDPSELDYIRAISRPGAVVRDINSTNWKYLKSMGLDFLAEAGYNWKSGKSGIPYTASMKSQFPRISRFDRRHK